MGDGEIEIEDIDRHTHLVLNRRIASRGGHVLRHLDGWLSSSTSSCLPMVKASCCMVKAPFVVLGSPMGVLSLLFR